MKWWHGFLVGPALLIVGWVGIRIFNALPFSNQIIIDGVTHDPWLVPRLQPKACDQWFRDDFKRWDRECSLGKLHFSE